MFPLQTTVPWRYPPIVTWLLIGANCFVFFIEIGLRPRQLDVFLQHWALVPARYAVNGGSTPADYLPFFTNIFLHGGWLHLILNMWTLWLFGPPIEDRLGSRRYLGFYLACGILASVTHALFNPSSTAPALGASGAIAGVLGCYIRLFPFARVIVLVLVIIFPLFFTVPAMFFVGFWFLMQVLQGAVDFFTPSSGGGIAWWAHVGGFVAGLALTPVLRRPPQRHRPYYADEGVHGFGPWGRR